MHPIQLESEALALGFIADKVLSSLEGIADEDEQSQVDAFAKLAQQIRLLYLTDASELAFQHPEILHLRTAGLLDVVQRIASKEGRMANQMAERAVATLEALAEGKEVSEEDLEHTKQLLGFVSEGTSIYVQHLQEKPSLL